VQNKSFEIHHFQLEHCRLEHLITVLNIRYKKTTQIDLVYFCINPFCSKIFHAPMVIIANLVFFPIHSENTTPVKICLLNLRQINKLLQTFHCYTLKLFLINIYSIYIWFKWVFSNGKNWLKQHIPTEKL